MAKRLVGRASVPRLTTPTMARAGAAQAFPRVFLLCFEARGPFTVSGFHCATCWKRESDAFVIHCLPGGTSSVPRSRKGVHDNQDGFLETQSAPLPLASLLWQTLVPASMGYFTVGPFPVDEVTLISMHS